jgi:hypothetical protein
MRKNTVARFVIAAVAGVGLCCTAVPASAATAPTAVVVEHHGTKASDVPKAAGKWCADIIKALAPAPATCVTTLKLDIPAPVGGVGGLPYEVGVKMTHPTKVPTQAQMDKVVKVLSPYVPFSQVREVKAPVPVKVAPPRLSS